MPTRLGGDNRTDQQKKVDKARALVRKFEAEIKERQSDVYEEGERNKREEESRMKTREERLEERAKRLREDKTHQMTKEIRELKLESLRARNRSRKKYEDFEREIKRLSEKLRQKDRLLNELRRDLARSEVDCEE